MEKNIKYTEDGMKREDFLKLTIQSISQIYSGKQKHCRCGCGGDYISTSYHNNPRSPINDKLAEKRLDRAKKLVNEGAEYWSYQNFIDITTGNNRTLTFYIDELKEPEEEYRDPLDDVDLADLPHGHPLRP